MKKITLLFIAMVACFVLFSFATKKEPKQTTHIRASVTDQGHYILESSSQF